MAVSVRTRFLVLKRDGFRCRYCGRGEPDVQLHVDHIEPKSNGGSDHPDNLIASCQTCNLGKSHHELVAMKPCEFCGREVGGLWITQTVGHTGERRILVCGVCIELCVAIITKAIWNDCSPCLSCGVHVKLDPESKNLCWAFCSTCLENLKNRPKDQF